MLEKELETAITLARKAGETILKFYENGFEIEEKIHTDNFSEPVTIADRTASKIIVEGLSNAFPNDGILSEEEFDDKKRLDKQRVWIIDPLDGTQGFINRNDDFAVQIGLAENGKAILGVVYMPTENVLYFASKDKGAWMIENEKAPKRLKVSGETNFARMNSAVSRNHRSPRMSLVVKSLGLKKEITRGSVGLKIGLIVQKFCDLYIHLSPRTKHWDTCAPEIILREAGGQMTDLFGAKITYNTLDVQNYNGVLASNGTVHDSLLTEFGRVKVKVQR
jgi:3'(2'), 5'-bisphosphate nucleotidase